MTDTVCLNCIYSTYLETSGSSEVEAVICSKLGIINEKDKCDLFIFRPPECKDYNECFKKQCQAAVDLLGPVRPFEVADIIAVCSCQRWNGRTWTCNFETAKLLNKSVKKGSSNPKTENLVISVEGMNFKQSPTSLIKGEEVVIVNVENLDTEWRKDLPRYLFSESENLDIHSNDKTPEISKAEKFRTFLETGEAIEMTEVFVREGWETKQFTDEQPFDSIIRFRDGRHRFSVLRDMGFKSMPISTDSESAKVIKTLFGD